MKQQFNRNRVLALLFSCLFISSIMIEHTEAGKKKILAALLIGAALAAKPKLLPLPLPVPVNKIKFFLFKYYYLL